MRQGPVQHLRDKDLSDMEEQLADLLFRIVFAGPVAAIRAVDPQTSKELQNAAQTALEKALRSGRVQYLSGVFTGEFGASIAAEIKRMGGKFDRHMKLYYIAPELVPAWVKAATETFRYRAKELHRYILDLLDKQQSSLEKTVDKNPVDALKTIDIVQSGFRASADAIDVSPKINEESKLELAREYSNNMKLYIKNFSETAIESLREVVEDNATKGYRFDRLIAVIRQRYGVTKSKAAFLARQETALFMAKYREMRFAEGGVTRYTWHTAQDEKVRTDHKHLNGKVFFYKNPPVVDRNTGRTGNPGQDFNCRCVDAPVVDRMAVAA